MQPIAQQQSKQPGLDIERINQIKGKLPCTHNYSSIKSFNVSSFASMATKEMRSACSWDGVRAGKDSSILDKLSLPMRFNHVGRNGYASAY